MNTQNKEKVYPIYKFHAKWNQDDYEGNSTGANIMYREEPTPVQLAKDLTKWWKEVLNAKRKGADKTPIADKNPHLLELKVEFYELESWCIGWFNHHTFSTEMSNEELRQSFYKFVQRKLPQHMNLQRGVVPGNPEIGTYCLMGAEDTWRWKEPCRCKHCVKHEKVTIDH